jgi:hypothetical protein
LNVTHPPSFFKRALANVILLISQSIPAGFAAFGSSATYRRPGQLDREVPFWNRARPQIAPGKLGFWPFLAKTAKTAGTQKTANARRLSDERGNIGIQCYRPSRVTVAQPRGALADGFDFNDENLNMSALAILQPASRPPAHAWAGVRECQPSDKPPRGDTAEMRIADDKGKPLDGVYLALADVEAKELRDCLEELVKTSEKGWHAHVMDERYVRSEDSERVEREVTVYRADDDEMVF